MRPVVLIGGAGAETALGLFTAEGVDARMVATAAELREADRQGIRYTLVHVGPDDGEPPVEVGAKSSGDCVQPWSMTISGTGCP